MLRQRATTAAALTTFAIALLVTACRQSDHPTASPAPTNRAPQPTPLASAATDAFDAWLGTDFPAADGFDPWLSADGDIRTVARGRVASASGGTVVIDHVFYENHERRQDPLRL